MENLFYQKRCKFSIINDNEYAVKGKATLTNEVFESTNTGSQEFNVNKKNITEQSYDDLIETDILSEEYYAENNQKQKKLSITNFRLEYITEQLKNKGIQNDFIQIGKQSISQLEDVTLNDTFKDELLIQCFRYFKVKQEQEFQKFEAKIKKVEAIIKKDLLALSFQKKKAKKEKSTKKLSKQITQDNKYASDELISYQKFLEAVETINADIVSQCAEEAYNEYNYDDEQPDFYMAKYSLMNAFDLLREIGYPIDFVPRQFIIRQHPRRVHLPSQLKDTFFQATAVPCDSVPRRVHLPSQLKDTFFQATAVPCDSFPSQLKDAFSQITEKTLSLQQFQQYVIGCLAYFKVQNQ